MFGRKKVKPRLNMPDWGTSALDSMVRLMEILISDFNNRFDELEKRINSDHKLLKDFLYLESKNRTEAIRKKQFPQIEAPTVNNNPSAYTDANPFKKGE